MKLQQIIGSSTAPPILLEEELINNQRSTVSQATIAQNILSFKKAKGLVSWVMGLGFGV